jgi:hypothetical protein
MLSKRCPFTGIINFYSEVEPHFSVGSISAFHAGDKDEGFTWRCYTDGGMTGGVAPDLQTAERRLANFLAIVETPPRLQAFRVA